MYFRASFFRQHFLDASRTATYARSLIGKETETYLVNHIGYKAEIEAAMNGEPSILKIAIAQYFDALYQASVELDGADGEDLQETLRSLHEVMFPTNVAARKERLAKKLRSMSHKELADYSCCANWLSY